MAPFDKRKVNKMDKFKNFAAESATVRPFDVDMNMVYLVGALAVFYVPPTDFRGSGFFVTDDPAPLGSDDCDGFFVSYDYGARNGHEAAIATVIGHLAKTDMERAQAVVSALTVRGCYEVIVTPKGVRREYDRIAGYENSFLIDIAAHPLEVAGLL